MTIQESIETAAEGLRRWWNGRPWWYLFIVTPGVLFATLAMYDCGIDSSIAERQQTAPGTIVSHEPWNHDRYGYSFVIDGKSYTGWHSPIGSEEPKIGQAVTVYYYPRDPNTSATVDFRELARESAGPVPFALGSSGLVAVFILIRRRATVART